MIEISSQRFSTFGKLVDELGLNMMVVECSVISEFISSSVPPPTRNIVGKRESMRITLDVRMLSFNLTIKALDLVRGQNGTHYKSMRTIFGIEFINFYVWYGEVWYGEVWYGEVWYGEVW